MPYPGSGLLPSSGLLPGIPVDSWWMFPAYPGSGFFPSSGVFPGIDGGVVDDEGFYDIDGGRGRLPGLSIEIDFDNDPTSATRTWTNVTHDARQISYAQSGRNDASQGTSTGTLSMLLDNRDGDYTPTNTTGVYYPNVKRMRWVRVRARWDGVIFPRWQGLIETWDQSWPAVGKDSVVSVRAADALKVLNLFKLGDLAYPEQVSGDRVTAVCVDVGIDSTVPSTGASTIVEMVAGGNAETTALAHLQSVEETENGRLFADAQGYIVFHDRQWRLTNPDSTTSVGVIGDGSGEIPYRETALAYDEQNIWNEVVVKTADGVPYAAEDVDSQDTYFRRTLNRTLLTNNAAEAQAAAEYLVRIYKDPGAKLPALMLLPIKQTTDWQVVLAASIGQRFTFKRRPDEGDTISIPGFVEQVSETIVPGTAWDVSLQLSPTEDSTFWVLGDAVNGRLGETTVVGY